MYKDDPRAESPSEDYTRFSCIINTLNDTMNVESVLSINTLNTSNISLRLYKFKAHFHHLKLWIATARHNFKWVKISI